MFHMSTWNGCGHGPAAEHSPIVDMARVSDKLSCLQRAPSPRHARTVKLSIAKALFVALLA